MTRRTALARARRGAAFLDSTIPGWRRKVRKTRLDMGEGDFAPQDRGDCGCILAQVNAGRTREGNYDVAAERLGIDPTGSTAERLGFYDDDGDFDVLTDAWRVVLDEPVVARSVRG